MMLIFVKRMFRCNKYYLTFYNLKKIKVKLFKLVCVKNARKSKANKRAKFK